MRVGRSGTVGDRGREDIDIIPLTCPTHPLLTNTFFLATGRNREDVGSRRRFLLYSVYTWVVGAILTTAVLVVPYLSGKTHDSSLMETNTEDCKLKSE